jgi:hypothetical protein
LALGIATINDWLLDEDMFLGSDGLLDEGIMRGTRGGDDDGTNVWIGQDLISIGAGLSARIFDHEGFHLALVRAHHVNQLRSGTLKNILCVDQTHRIVAKQRNTHNTTTKERGRGDSGMWMRREERERERDRGERSVVCEENESCQKLPLHVM